MLRKPVLQHKGSCLHYLMQCWNNYRNAISFHPPPGWPTNVIIFLILGCVMFYTVLQGCKRIQSCKKNKTKLYVFQTTKEYMLNKTPCTFYSDTDVIIVNNSANCIVWTHKRLYIPITCRVLNTKSSPSIDTAAGQGSVVGIGDIKISWLDDFGKKHQFTFTDVFHIPNSPVNVLGISTFSNIIGDYESKGTQINSSGQDSVLTWDNGRYQ